MHACPRLPADSNRRESFVNHQLAVGAAAKELGEVQARMLMERELAQAQQQVSADRRRDKCVLQLACRVSISATVPAHGSACTSRLPLLCAAVSAAQAAARTLVVAKEKAANEAKSEFMSLMCHEVRRRLAPLMAAAQVPCTASLWCGKLASPAAQVALT